MSDNLWAQVIECFNTDDGSLPGIEITNLSAIDMAAIYAMLRSRSKLFGEPSVFWSRSEKASLPVDSVPNAAAMVASEQSEPFHHCISGIIAAGVQLPVLGVFVFPDTVELDYRMGDEWGLHQVAGFFELIRDCCAIAPNAVVVPASFEGPPYPDKFTSVWTQYSKSKNC